VPYRVLVGLSYPPDRNVEPGKVVDDIPQQSVKWLLAAGAIENVTTGSRPDNREDGD
jgi:hypothetical protein